MATTVQLSYKGKWRLVPQCSAEAYQLGWHKGVDIPTGSWFSVDGKYQYVYDWCKETVDIHYFKMFEDSVWFIDNQDALLCQLRWS